ncbi:unnamed protein product [Ectocarpus sp. 12 AP-2014]
MVRRRPDSTAQMCQTTRTPESCKTFRIVWLITSGTPCVAQEALQNKRDGKVERGMLVCMTAATQGASVLASRTIPLQSKHDTTWHLRALVLVARWLASI